MEYPDWTGMALYQNQSPIMGARILPRISPDHLLGWPPSPPETEEPPTPPSADIIQLEEGHSRPLPPPLNPNVVRRQAMHLRNWTSLDDEGELMIATPPRKRAADNLDEPDIATPPEIEVEPIHTQAFNFEAFAISGEALYSFPPKKRRLFENNKIKGLTNPVAHEALPRLPEAALAYNRESVNQPSSDVSKANHSSGTTRHLLHVFEEDSTTSSDDSAKDDLACNSEEKDLASLSSASDEEDLVKYHARLHRKSMSKIETNSHPKEPSDDRRYSTTSKVIDYVLARKEKEEHESAERSRLRRKRRLSMPSNGISDDTDPRSIDIVEDKSNTAPAGESPWNATSALLDRDACITDTSDFPDHRQDKDSTLPPPISTPNYAQRPGLQPVNVDLTEGSTPSYETDIEALLDISQDYNGSTSTARVDLNRCNSRHSPTNRQSFRQHDANPFSRAAAERFRTQSRHLDNLSKYVPQTDMGKCDLAADARLRHFTEKLEKPKLAVQYLQPDCNSTHAQQGTQGRGLPPCLPDDTTVSCGSNSPLSLTDRTHKSMPISRPKPHLTSLELQTLKASHKARREHSTQSWEVPLAELAPLGQAGDVDLDNAGEVREESERLKSQKKDLKVIKETFEKIAIIRSVGDLYEKEEEELKECRRFVNLVIDKRQPGRARRPRMQCIRDNMAARISRIDTEMLPENHTKVQEFYEDFLGQQRALVIEEALERIDEEIEQFAIHRAKHRHSSKTTNVSRKKKKVVKPEVQLSVKKQVRWEDLHDTHGRVRSDLPSGTEIDLDGPPASKLKPKKLNKTEREIKALTERVKLFEAGRPSSISSNIARQLSDNSNERGSDDDKSEAESGEIRPGSEVSFMSSRTFSRREPIAELDIDEDLDEINRLEDERQRSEAKSKPAACSTAKADAPKSRQSSQLLDPLLITSMKTKYSNMGMAQITRGAENEDDALFDVWTDSDCTAPSESDFSESDVEETIQVYRYHVVGQFVGVSLYRDADEISFARFHAADKANERVQAIISDIHREYGAQFSDGFELNTRRWNGLLEQVLCIGANNEVQARVAVERQLKEVNLSRLNASKAQKRQLVRERNIYQVSWEKTTTTTITPNAIIANKSVSNNATDDLFSPDLPLAPITITEVEHCPDPIMHCDLAAANQMAKEDFMLWYSRFFPESERKRSQQGKRGRIVYSYSGFLRQVDDAQEVKLRELAGTAPYEVEEEVERTIDSGDGEVGESQDSSKVVKEKIKVFVETKPVLGPVN